MAELDRTKPFPLYIDDFVGPDRRYDAFPSIKYLIPRTYQADTIEIKFARDSAVTCMVEDHYIYMEPDDILLLAPYAIHTAHVIHSEGRILNVVLRPGQAAKALPRLYETDNPIHYFLQHCTEKNGPLYLHLPASRIRYDTTLLERIVEYCIKERKPQKEKLLQLEAKLEALLLDILLQLPENDAMLLMRSEAADELSMVFGYIQQNLSDATLAEAAKELGWNASHLSRFVKQRTDRSFTDLIQVLRMDEAASLLLYTDLPVDEIMRRVGYTGKTHFYRLFAERFHTSPAEYRRSAQVSAQTQTAG